MTIKTRRAYERRIQELENQLALNSKKIYGRDLNEQIARIITRVMDVNAAEFRATICGEVMVLAGMISAEALIRADEAWRDALAKSHAHTEAECVDDDISDTTEIADQTDSVYVDQIPSELLDTASATDENSV